MFKFQTLLDKAQRLSLSHVAIALLIAFFLQSVVLSFVRSGTSYDGAEQLLYTQYLDLGYGRSQPPLFTWLLWSVHQIIGVNQLAENFIKFGLLGLGFILLGAVSRKLGYSNHIAIATLFSAFLLVEIGWESQRNYTHTVLLFALSGAFAFTYLSLLRGGSMLLYPLLGLIFGLIILSKYNGALLIVALIFADLSMREARLFARRMSIWFWIVAAAVVSPHFIWGYAHPDAVLALSNRFVDAEQGYSISGIALGLGQYSQATLGLWLPVTLMLGAVAYFGQRQSSPLISREVSIFLRWAMILWAIGLFVVFITEANVVRMRWLAPLTVPLLPVLVGEALRRKPNATQAVTAIGLALGVISICGQWYESTRMNARTDYNYEKLNADLLEAKLPIDLVFANYAVFANMRLYRDAALIAPFMPNARSLVGENATLLWLGSDQKDASDIEAYARILGLCREAGADVKQFTLYRRHGGDMRMVSALPVSRKGCLAF